MLFTSIPSYCTSAAVKHLFYLFSLKSQPKGNFYIILLSCMYQHQIVHATINRTLRRYLIIMWQFVVIACFEHILLLLMILKLRLLDIYCYPPHNSKLKIPISVASPSLLLYILTIKVHSINLHLQQREKRK